MTIPGGVASHLRGLRHIGIVTEDLDALLARLQSVFGIGDEQVIRVSGPDSRFAFFTIGNVPYEVIQPVSAHFRELLLNRESGINHVCYNVDDLSAAIAAMAAIGVRLGHVTPEGTIDLPHARMAYFDPRDTGGLLIEFVEPRT